MISDNTPFWLGETIFAPIGASSDFASHEVGNLMPLFEHIEQNGVPPGIHLLKLADANCLSTIDHCGNEFNVSSAGGSSTNCDSGTTEPGTNSPFTWVTTKAIIIVEFELGMWL